MSARRLVPLACGLACLALAAAQAQQPPSKPVAPAKPTPPAANAPAAPASAAQGRDAFKGKLKPGLYEVTMESDMSNTPGVPKDKAKHVDKRQQCITQQEVDKGIEHDPNCPVSSFASSGNQISISATCKDGARTDTRMTFTPNGYTAEMKVSAKHEGKAVGSTHKVTSRYIGPCK